MFIHIKELLFFFFLFLRVVFIEVCTLLGFFFVFFLSSHTCGVSKARGHSDSLHSEPVLCTSRGLSRVCHSTTEWSSSSPVLSGFYPPCYQSWGWKPHCLLAQRGSAPHHHRHGVGTAARRLRNVFWPRRSHFAAVMSLICHQKDRKQAGVRGLKCILRFNFEYPTFTVWPRELFCVSPSRDLQPRFSKLMILAPPKI